ncbi:MAG TPA: aldo/keto reductase [Candidatus Binatia bacterium]|jgi:aryl-alcohol dehydrogenase-like predicted oxidoreductase
MVPRPLGRTGLSVSPVGLGTVKLGRNTDVKYPTAFNLPLDRQLEKLLDTALDLGVNLIDTAPAYGSSEARLGPFVAAHRERIVLATKAGERYENGRSTYDFSAQAITASVENSLRNLKTDCVDILVLHSNGEDEKILTETDALAALAALKRSGKVRAAGISAKTEKGIVLAIQSLDVVMAPFSEKDQALADALSKAHAAGIGVLAIKGLFSGHLPASAAIEFVLKQSFIDALIVGTIDPAHLKEAIEAADNIARRR